MFAPHTIAAITALAVVDGGVTPRERDALCALLRGRSPSAPSPSAVVKYPEVARLTGLSLATVKRMARGGAFTKVYTNEGAAHACGVTAASVERYINNANQQGGNNAKS